MDSDLYEEHVARIVKNLFTDISELNTSNTQFGRTSHVNGASGHSHQIDVQISGDSDLYLVECKYWDSPVTVDQVLAFYGRIADIQNCQSRSVHGSMVTNHRYQPGAEKVAAYFEIDLDEVKSESEFSIHFKGSIWKGIRDAELKGLGGDVTAIVSNE